MSNIKELPAPIPFTLETHPIEEALRSPEPLYRAKFAVLIVSGKGSVGNTSLAENAALSYGIPSENVYHAGKIVREYDETMRPNSQQENPLKPIERPREIDENVDAETARRILEATPENPQIIEAKLAGAILRHLEQLARDGGERLAAPRVAVLKWADSDKRAQIAKAKKKELTIREIKEITRTRDNFDYTKWYPVHPWLEEYSNIFEKNAKDNEGNPLYQITIDASNHESAEVDLEELTENLHRLGLIEPIEHELTAGEEQCLPSQAN